MIDEEKTFEKMGYRSSDLSRSSSRKIWAVCNECGKERWVRFYAYSDLCQKCAMQQVGKRIKSGVTNRKKSSNYCSFFDGPKKVAVRNYFNNKCFECGKTTEDNKNRKLSVHHVNYRKDCGCGNAQFCIYVPLCGSCHITTNSNRWQWYTRFMTELAIRNPNYYAYHVPVVYYDEPSYNYEYVFEKTDMSNQYINNRPLYRRATSQCHLNTPKIKAHARQHIPMKRTTIYLEDDQKKRIDELPRHVSFSAAIRNNFDIIIKSCKEESFVREIR